MASVIESLVVELGLDPKNFSDNQKKVLDDYKKMEREGKKAGDEAEREAKRAMQFATQLRNQIIALYAVFTAGRGIKEFVADLTAADSALGRLAFRLDTSAATLSTWRGAGAFVGATAEEIYGSFQSLTNTIQQFATTGQASALPWLRAMGINLVDVNGKARNLNDVFMDMSRWAQHQDHARAAFFLQQAGVSAGMTNLILQGPDALQRMLDLGARYKQTPADIAAATEMQFSFVRLELASTRLGRTLKTELTPIIDKLADALSDLADWLNANPAALNIVATGLSVLGGILSLRVGLGALVAIKNLANLTKILGGAGVAAEGATAAFSGMELVVGAITFGTVIAGIGAVILALDELINHWDSVKEFGKDLVGKNFGGPDNTLPHKLAWQKLGMMLAPWAPWALPLILYGQGLYDRRGASTTAGIPYAGRRLLDTIARSESNGAYNVMYGGSTFSSYANHPNIPHLITSGPNAGQNSTAAGRYQFTYGTWKRAQKALGLTDFSPVNQDRAAWWLAQHDYSAYRPGRSLFNDLMSGNPALLADIGRVLHSTWEGVGAGSFLGPQGGFSAGVGAGTSVRNSSVSHSRSVTVGQVVIHTQASDAHGIARDFNKALDRASVGAQSDYGLA